MRRMTHDPGGKSKLAWPAESKICATFKGPNDCYRPTLEEIWDATKPLVMWLLMNPSVASAQYADPTLKRTGNFTRAWGFGGQLVGNVHDYRVTDSKLLSEVEAPSSRWNDDALIHMSERAKFVVLAYGLPPKPLRARSEQVVQRLALRGCDLRYLAVTAGGTPRHPLYLPAGLVPLPWPVKPKGV